MLTQKRIPLSSDIKLQSKEVRGCSYLNRTLNALDKSNKKVLPCIPSLLPIYLVVPFEYWADAAYGRVYLCVYSWYFPWLLYLVCYFGDAGKYLLVAFVKGI